MAIVIPTLKTFPCPKKACEIIDYIKGEGVLLKSPRSSQGNKMGIIREIKDFKNSIVETKEDKNTVKFRTILLTTEINKNRRKYPLMILQKAVHEFNNKIRARKAWGGQDHPEGVKNLAIKDVSHILTRAEVKDEKVYIEGEILKNTPEGKKILSMINVGTVGISARGAGTMISKKDSKGEKYNEVNMDYKLIGADFVPDQSVNIATVSKGNLFESAPIEIEEEKFFSLRKELESAIRSKFGKKAWITDFSNDEVIYRIYTDGSEVDAEGEDIYFKINYKISNKEIELVGDPKKVERKTTYEATEEDLHNLYINEYLFSGGKKTFTEYKESIGKK